MLGRYGLIPGSGGGGGVAGPATEIADPDETLSIDQFVDGDVVIRSGNTLTTATAAELAAIVEPELSAGGVTTYDYHDARPALLGAASANDIEFGTMDPTDAGFSYNTAPSGTPNILTLNNTAAPKASWKGAMRAGHGAVQPIDATPFICTKGSLTLAANSWYHFRCPIDGGKFASPSGTEFNYFRIELDDGTSDNRVYLMAGGTDWSGTDYAALITKVTATVTESPVGISWTPYGGRVDEILILKNGTNYYGYAKTFTGWRYVGLMTHASTFTRIRLLLSEDGSAAPGTAILYPKFFRCGDTLLAGLP